MCLLVPKICWLQTCSKCDAMMCFALFYLVQRAFISEPIILQVTWEMVSSSWLHSSFNRMCWCDTEPINPFMTHSWHPSTSGLIGLVQLGHLYQQWALIINQVSQTHFQWTVRVLQLWSRCHGVSWPGKPLNNHLILGLMGWASLHLDGVNEHSLIALILILCWLKNIYIWAS